MQRTKLKTSKFGGVSPFDNSSDMLLPPKFHKGPLQKEITPDKIEACKQTTITPLTKRRRKKSSLPNLCDVVGVVVLGFECLYMLYIAYRQWWPHKMPLFSLKSVRAKSRLFQVIRRGDDPLRMEGTHKGCQTKNIHNVCSDPTETHFQCRWEGSSKKSLS
jgi:hypothetical protein